VKAASHERCFERAISLQQRCRAGCADARSARQLVGRVAAQGYEIRNLRRIDAIPRADLGRIDTCHLTRADGIKDGGAIRGKLKRVAISACNEDGATPPFFSGGGEKVIRFIARRFCILEAACGDEFRQDMELRSPAAACAPGGLPRLCSAWLRRAWAGFPPRAHIAKHDPCGGVIARILCAAYPAIDASLDEALRCFRVKKQMIEAKSGVALPPVSHVIPKCVHRYIGMQRADRVYPTPIEKPPKEGARLRLHERVVLIGFARVDIRFGRHDVVVARQHDGRIERIKLGGVRQEPLHPNELVFFGPGCGLPFGA